MLIIFNMIFCIRNRKTTVEQVLFLHLIWATVSSFYHWSSQGASIINWKMLSQLKQFLLKFMRLCFSLIPAIDIKPPGSRMNKILKATSKSNADIYSQGR